MFHADLHIHSRFSRACSKDCDIEHLSWWALRKGLRVLGTGDFTHPAWAAELRETLLPAEPGLFRIRPDLEKRLQRDTPASCQGPVRFMLSVEISTIYRRDDRTRKVHHLLYAPDFAAADRITAALAKIGNLASDGAADPRAHSRDLLDIALSADPGCFLVPAHVWTPVVRGPRLQVRLRRGAGLLRRPGRPHLRGGDRPVLGPADELGLLLPRSVPAGQQLRRAFPADARPRGHRVRHRPGLLLHGGGAAHRRGPGRAR